MYIHKKSRDELESEMRDQIVFLRSSAEAFDAGIESEAKRLSTTISTLVHDGGRSVSLLKQLGLRTKLPLISTVQNTRTVGADRDGAVFVPASTPLTFVSLNENGSVAIPICSATTDCNEMPWAHPIKFHDWWEGENIASPDRREMTRKNLIWIVRCQEGGAHLDAHITNESYIEFRNNPMVPGAYRIINGKRVNSSPAHWASIRQIAWELDEALKILGF